MEINMMVNGKMIKKKEKEYIIIKVEIYMMVNGKMMWKKDKENLQKVKENKKEFGKMVN